jgi:hypothetical protein
MLRGNTQKSLSELMRMHTNKLLMSNDSYQYN